MKELFVSEKCIDCRQLMAEADFHDRFQDAEIIDITESMPNLKRFLAYRDRLSAYQPVRDGAKVGVPSLVKNGTEVEFFIDK